MNSQKNSSQLLFDACCIATLIGIWPRFIEPNLLFTTYQSIPIDKLAAPFEGFKIAVFSDLHFNKSLSNQFLDKIARRIARFKPDLIALSGDFLCFSKCDDEIRLKKFLGRFHAPFGCYAVLGNHDYNTPLTINEMGDYAPLKKGESTLKKGIRRLCSSLKPTGHASPELSEIYPAPTLVQLLANTSFKLLHNETVQIEKQNTRLNLTGLGEVSANYCRPEIAYQGYDKKLPGIVLAHNPDAISRIKDYPGDLVLSGHTHGGQINLPWVWSKLTLLENPHLKAGLFQEGSKALYVTRGVGSVAQFRLFTPPELTFITLSKKI